LGGKGGSSSALGSMRVAMAGAVAAPTRASFWLGPGFVTSTKPRGKSTDFGIFFMSRARIRALARKSSMCRELTASVSGGLFAVAM
jgi:hypothetical protein